MIPNRTQQQLIWKLPDTGEGDILGESNNHGVCTMDIASLKAEQSDRHSRWSGTVGHSLGFLTSTRMASQATDVRRNVCCQSLQHLSSSATLRNIAMRPLHGILRETAYYATPYICRLAYFGVDAQKAAAPPRKTVRLSYFQRRERV